MEGTLARGALWVFGINVAGTGVAFLVQLELARSLGASDYGVYVYTLGWLNVVLLFAKLDWDHVSLRFLSAYAAQQQWALFRGFLRRSDVIVVLTSTSAAAIAALLTWTLRARLAPGMLDAYLAACALLPVTAVLQVKSIALQGLKRVVASQAPVTLVRPLLFGIGIGIVAIAAGGERHLSAAVAIAINLAATAVVLVGTWWLLRRATPAQVTEAPPEFATGEWLRVSGGMLVISAAQLVLSQSFDVVVVGTLLDTTVAGYYGAASQLAVLCHFGVNAVLFMATPLIAELFARGDRVGLQRLVTITGRINLAVSLPIIVALLAFGRYILSWYGPSFVTAYPVLLVLLGGQLVGTSVGSLAGFLMTMTGQQNRAAMIIGGSAILYLVLSFALTIAMGPVGTALATCLAYLARGIVLDIDIRRRLGIEAFPFAIRRPARDRV